MKLLHLVVVQFVFLCTVMTGNAEPLQVQIHDGTVWRGDISCRSDGGSLWLQRQLGTTTVLRPVGWDAISRVEYLGQEMTPTQLKSHIRNRQSKASAESSMGILTPFGPYNIDGYASVADFVNHVLGFTSDKISTFSLPQQFSRPAR